MVDIKYPKIQTLFKRCVLNGPDKNKLIVGDWTLPEFELLREVPWEATEKIDGTNIRVMWNGEQVEFGGRTENAQIHASLVNYLIRTFTADVFRDAQLPPMTIFGEGFGSGIGKMGKMYLPDDVSFLPFDIQCDGLWLKRNDVVEISHKLNLEPVRQLSSMTLDQAISYVKSGFKSNIGTAPAEGLVLRAPLGLLTRRGERIMAKIKTRDFVKGTVLKPRTAYAG